MIDSEIHGTQRPDPKKIRCRDCLYRDKTVVTLGGEKVKVGITKDTCLFFNKPGNWKPTSILFQNADCPFYEHDEGA